MSQVLELPVQTRDTAPLFSLAPAIPKAVNKVPALASHRVVLVSSHPLYLVGLRVEFTPWDDFKVVGQATDAAEVLSLVSNSPVSLIIIDQTRPGEALPILNIFRQKLKANIPMVVLGSSETEAEVNQLSLLGVTKFISKTLSGSELHEVLRQVMHGRRPLPGIRSAEPDGWSLRSMSQSQSVTALRRGKTGELKAKAPLSPREIQILEVIAQGCSNKEVAQILCISNHTLKNHLNNIFKKLNVEDRTQALLLGVRNGWIRL